MRQIKREMSPQNALSRIKMLSIPHPLVTKVEKEYRVLDSLISELPQLYMRIADEMEQKAIVDAEAASEGDNDVYLTVYNSYASAIDFFSEVPTTANGYLLAAIYAFYERNVKGVYKELGIESRKVYPQVAFTNCNIPIESNRRLFDQINLIRLVRDNQSHGKLNNEMEMKQLTNLVSCCKGFCMIENEVYITDSRIIHNALERINDFFHLVFKTNSQFATRYIGGGAH